MLLNYNTKLGKLTSCTSKDSVEDTTSGVLGLTTVGIKMS